MMTPNSVQQLAAAGEPPGENSPLQIGQRLAAAGELKRRADEAWKALCDAEQERTNAEAKANAAYREWGERNREYRAASSPGDMTGAFSPADVPTAQLGRVWSADRREALALLGKTA